MRLLIYILALTSAFFVSAEPDMSDLKSPKSEPEDLFQYSCRINNKSCPDLELPSGSDEVALQNLASTFLSSIRSGFVEGCVSLGTTSTGVLNYRIDAECTYGNNQGEPDEWTATQGAFISVSFIGAGNILSCPPDDSPNYNIPVLNDSGEKMCAKQIGDCPAGYHSRAVSKAMGSDSCMPKECPAAGSGEDLYSSKMTGGVPFNGGGMYCNDGCAYSVKSENVTSDQYALGTSQGAACGDKPYDNKKLSDEGDEGQCETNTVDGVTIMFCNNEPAPPTDKDDDANNDGSKEDETEKPKKDLEDCASDDNACMLRNLIKEQSNNTQVQIENDNKLHNKMVDTATNNTNILKTAIDDLHTTVFVGLQKNDKLEAVKASKMNDLISAVREGNQILTDKPIGGGGGGGNGGGDGEGEGGGDCEGGAADCVPIAGSEIPKEVVNLSQYADKYDDWLPNAELPEEKCIVLTTGQSLCFSFSAFIILFQAISGLIVISSLLHSARIIAGAI